METQFSPFGSYPLKRYPYRKNETLRAWDAADELVLNYLAGEVGDLVPTPFQSTSDANNQSTLILNDQFGGLAVPLHNQNITVIGDSFLAIRGIEKNLELNALNIKSITTLTSVEIPTGQFERVLIKIPKSLALLEHQLYQLRPLIAENTQVVAAGMIKSIHKSTLALFEKIIGSTKTSLAKKKARLIFCQPAPSLLADNSQSPYPKQYQLEGTNYTISNHANVFSREKLDIGTRFFLEHLPSSEQPLQIVDLGCGNGVVGLIAAEKNPEAELTFVDESFMAVRSAQDNFERAFKGRDAKFIATDCLAGVEPNSADLILNNPPFHQQNVVGDHIAWQMFTESKSVLKQGGKLWVIGNRHLGYHTKLKRLFGNCQTVASNNKFVILKAVKR